MRRAFSLSLALALALAACSHKPVPSAVDTLDAQLTQGDIKTDPALTGALADQIMVDPGLAQQANNHSARMPPAPLQMQLPVGNSPGDDPLRGAPSAPGGPTTLGQMAQAAPRGGDACTPALDYSATWVNRLPSEAPLYPDARVQEAAGDARPGCTIRVVSFSSGDAPARLFAFYRDAAARAGYATKLSGSSLAGRRARDGGALRVSIAAREDGGSDVDLIVNGGR